jgi:DNA topoisomerase IA
MPNDGKSKNIGLINELEVSLDTMEANQLEMQKLMETNHEEIQKIIEELKTSHESMRKTT